MAGHALTRFDRWVERAGDYGDTEDEKAMYVFNARNLLTLWAPKEASHELRDYAHREWAGLIKPFYKKRWQAYLRNLELWFDDREHLPAIDWKEFDYVFAMSDTAYAAPACPALKDTVEAALAACR